LTTPAQRPIPAAQVKKEPDEVPMQIDRARRPDTRKCFRCGETGHICARCPHNPTQAAIRLLMSNGELDAKEFANFAQEASVKADKEAAEQGFGDHQ
jgi:hypothetical protein